MTTDEKAPMIIKNKSEALYHMGNLIGQINGSANMVYGGVNQVLLQKADLVAFLKGITNYIAISCIDELSPNPKSTPKKKKKNGTK